ncbi:unnamed protein product [Durusdinium trenchii]|uniref:Nucleoside diphosphate kinase-like domain-containing protein n=1 Tax=Durusdinium trenchii TaxID=1381693 RepID=A0ABP0RIZ1_9DINO
MSDAHKYNFVCEHVEEASQMTKEFLLTVYSKGNGNPNELSLYDTKSKRLFLKRGVYDQDGAFRLEDLFIGAEVTVCARKMKIVSFADKPTEALFQKNSAQVYTVISGAATTQLATLFLAAYEMGFTIKRVKTLADAGEMAVHLELVGQGLDVWQEAIEQVSDGTAIRTELGGPTSEKVFARKESSATFEGCSLCIIRPHAVREGKAGAVISAVMEAALQISALQSFVLLKSQAENFYEAGR